MDKQVITRVNFLLSAQDITSYDLLLAMGEGNLVPDSIRNDRISRILKRDGKESPEGYIKNAIEDLSKMNFSNKTQVMSMLQSQLGRGLSGFGQTATPAPPPAPSVTATTATTATVDQADVPPPLPPDVIAEQSTFWGMVGVGFLLLIPVILIFRKQLEDVVRANYPAPPAPPRKSRKKSRKRKN